MLLASSPIPSISERVSFGFIVCRRCCVLMATTEPSTPASQPLLCTELLQGFVGHEHDDLRK
jgi:hypothetical protein